MKIKYTGSQDEITVRHVTFPQGKAVELRDDDPADMRLAEKVLAIADFAEVKPRGRREKSDGDEV